MEANVLAAICLLLSSWVNLARGSIITMDPDGGYKNIIVAIHDSIPEDKYILHNMREIFINASEFLYSATKGQAYFKEVFIAIPSTWSNSPSYEEVSGNFFSSADVRIDKRNPEHGEAPYTLQPGECGEPGQYIHLTPDFVKEVRGKTYENFGNPGRQLVHEWAHLRYGVFDEYGIPGDWRYPMFYTENGRIRPTTCIRDIEGWIESKNGGACSLVEGEVDKDCIFIPDIRSTKAKASIMYMPFIPSIEGFCEETADEERRHNPKAPTKQNAMCNYRSTWDVILSHSDFIASSSDTAPQRPDPFMNTKPGFRMMKSSVPRYVLLLDVSGSMRGRPIELLHRSATRFVEDRVPDGSYLGIVQFSTGAKILHNLTKVDGQTRETLSRSLPGTDDNGNTAIGLGLQAALKVLTNNNSSKTSGGIIILITDGEENRSPYIADVLPEILKAEVKVNTIAFGQKATVHLENITQLTGGRGYFFGDIRGEQPATAVDSAFLKSVTAQADVDLQPVEITQTSVNIDRDAIETSVTIDDELGKNTIFTVTSTNINAVEVTLSSPSGKKINPRDPEYHKDTSRGMRILIRLNNAESGKWKVEFRKADAKPVMVSYSVTSEPRDPKIQPIRVRSWFSELQLKFPAHAKIFAEVKKGYNAVVGASVVAVVERPMGKPVEVQLRDNGAGADITANDGIYTTYFSQFHGNGRYAVLAHVINDGSAKLKTGSLGSSGIRIPTSKEPNAAFKKNASSSFAPEEFIPGEKKANTTEQEEDMFTIPASMFERISDAGAFRVEEWDPTIQEKDIIPPNRITDLVVVHAEDTEGYKKAILEWTSPGNDLEEGNADRLKIMASISHETLVKNFDDAFMIDENWIINGTLTPIPSGSKQRIHVQVPLPLMLPSGDDAGDNTNAADSSGMDLNITDVYFAVRALDESGNAGDVSNIAAANFAPLVAGNENDMTKDNTASDKQSGKDDSWSFVPLLIGIGVAILVICLVILVIVMCQKKRKRGKMTP